MEFRQQKPKFRVKLFKISAAAAFCAVLAVARFTAAASSPASSAVKPTGKPHSTPKPTSKPLASMVAAGYEHTCALLAAGSVKCWGYNNYGQLGDGTLVKHATPVSVVTLGGAATAVTAGLYHTCALLGRGSIKCWGHNEYGQLGNGTHSKRATPVAVRSLSGAAIAVTAGFAHTCALLTGGSIKCWGDNEDGRLGDGTLVKHATPVSVVSLGGAATAVTAGGFHTCALLAGGSIKCWGDNSNGALGDGTTNNHATPVSVVSLGGNATAVAAGFTHTCALLANRSIKCWGANDYGGLGDGTTNNHATPVTVVSLGGAAIAVTAGEQHTCALLTDGQVKCWGYNQAGELGDGTTKSHNTPAAVGSLGGAAAAVTAGYFYTCASLAGGSVKCWGENNYGQLGDGTNFYRYLPVSVIGL